MSPELGLLSLIAALREQLGVVTAERDAALRGKTIPLSVGVKCSGALVVAYEDNQYHVRCKCGVVFKRGITLLRRAAVWQCRSCHHASRRP